MVGQATIPGGSFNLVGGMFDGEVMVQFLSHVVKKIISRMPALHMTRCTVSAVSDVLIAHTCRSCTSLTSGSADR